ncbi:hypothetical protein DY000_02039202 [Brassica cretica]|uniref:Secreted protein n=1 Tax=Brassica cretica TaxID=69181 RepID=A0ABQ7BGW0_BRACR|nr:hypothetical protein DY000_02039202 [Brassica cretica]
MLLPPLCLLRLSLVSPGNFIDLGCRLLLLRKHLRNSMRRQITTRVVSLVRSEPCTERIFPNHIWNPRSGVSQRLCSDYYDQDGETRRLSDERQDTCLRNWRGREKRFLEDG